MSLEVADFCKREYPRLVGALGLWCGDRAVAEELAQETLARVWQRWHRVKALDNPEAWAHRVALNLARSQWRRRMAEKRARERAAEVDASAEGPDLAASVALKSAIASLSKRKRTALILHYYLDLPFKEVAEIMQVPESTAKSLGRRAVQDLRSAIAGPESKEVWDAG